MYRNDNNNSVCSLHIETFALSHFKCNNVRRLTWVCKEQG